MNFLLTTLLALASFTILPAQTLVTTEIQEEPHALPLVAAGGATGIGSLAGKREEIWEEDDREVLIRSERGTKPINNNGSGTASSSCRYTKSPWTDCDIKTNTRSRTLTLKNKSDNCVPTRTIQKKCKKACRYEKGIWSDCITGEMTRTDTLKSTSDSTCQLTRVINKHCNPKSKDKTIKERKNKEKGARKGRA